MNIYKLNGIDLSEFGIIPSKSENSNIAISGAWDMPSRLGKCFHDWGNDENGMEPYVSADEIRFGGVDIFFTGKIKAVNKLEALNKCFALFTAINAFTGLVPFETVFGTYSVFINGEIQIKYIGQGYCSIDIPMRMPTVLMSNVIPTNGIDVFDGFGIDGVMFKNLGLLIGSVDGQFDRAKPKSGEFTRYEHEGFKITKTEANELIIKAKILQNSYASFLAVIEGLKALFSAADLRTLTRKNDFERSVFAKDGFQISDVFISDSVCMASFSMKLLQAKIVTPIEPPYNGVVDDLNNKFTFTANEFGTPTPPPTNGIVDDFNNKFTYTPNTI